MNVWLMPTLLSESVMKSLKNFVSVLEVRNVFEWD